MKSFIDRFSNLVKGTISEFDRIVFKVLVLPLVSARQVTALPYIKFSTIWMCNWASFMSIINRHDPLFEGRLILLVVVAQLKILLVGTDTIITHEESKIRL